MERIKTVEDNDVTKSGHIVPI